jgi:tetratricopeptide (TPR) repeat protein
VGPLAAPPSKGSAIEAELVVASVQIHDHLLFMGRYDAANAVAAALDGLGDRLPTAPEVEAALHRTSSMRAFFRGDLGEACDRMALAIAGFEAAGDLRQACMMRGNAAFFSAEIGAAVEAAALGRAVLAEAERMGLSSTAGTAKSNLGYALCRLGETDEAEALEIAAVAESVAQQNRRFEATSRAYLADILKRRGDLVAADAEARRAVALLAAYRPLLPVALAILCGVLLAQGRAPEALSCAREAYGVLEALGQVEEGESRVRLCLVEALDATGDRAGAREAVASARARLLARADKIASPAWRRRFLEDVPENARTLALAGAWLGNAG